MAKFQKWQDHKDTLTLWQYDAFPGECDITIGRGWITVRLNNAPIEKSAEHAHFIRDVLANHSRWVNWNGVVSIAYELSAQYDILSISRRGASDTTIDVGMRTDASTL